MLTIIVCLFVVFCIVADAEFLWRKKILRGEAQRKLIHICTGCFIATWPWLMSWRAIWIIGLLMALVVSVNRILPILHFSARINRESYGDIFFALAVAASAALVTNKTFFAIAILNMSLADGLAALIGKKYGKKNGYKIFGQKKSLQGTAAFWLTSLIIIAVGLAFQSVGLNDYLLAILLLPPLLTIVENCVVLGFDNLAVPLVALLALSNIN